jgi:hypothetical protein
MISARALQVQSAPGSRGGAVGWLIGITTAGRGVEVEPLYHLIGRSLDSPPPVSVRGRYTRHKSYESGNRKERWFIHKTHTLTWSECSRASWNWKQVKRPDRKVKQRDMANEGSYRTEGEIVWNTGK